LTEAEQRFEAGLHRKPTIVGYDADRSSVSAAQQAVVAAGMSGRVHVERRELSDAAPPARSDGGLVAVNPPYGERLGEVGELRLLYRSLGALLAERFSGWRVGVLTGSEQLAGSLGLEPAGRDTLYNGALECDLLRIELGAGSAPAGDATRDATGDATGDGVGEDAGDEAPKESNAAPNAAPRRLRGSASQAGPSPGQVGPAQ